MEVVFKYVQSRLIWRHVGPNQCGAVGIIGKIQIIKWRCSSEDYLHFNVLMRFKQVASAPKVEIAMHCEGPYTHQGYRLDVRRNLPQDGQFVRTLSGKRVPKRKI